MARVDSSDRLIGELSQCRLQQRTVTITRAKDNGSGGIRINARITNRQPLKKVAQANREVALTGTRVMRPGRRQYGGKVRNGEPSKDTQVRP